MRDGRTLWFVWLVAISLAVLTTRLLIGMSPPLFLAQEAKVPLEVDLILGSSLSKTLLPPYAEVPSLMNDRRDTEVLSVPGATAQETLHMLEWAADNTRGNVAIEVNAFTLQYSHLSIHGFPWLTAALEGQTKTAANMTLTLKHLVGVTPDQVRKKRVKFGRSKQKSPFSNDTRKRKHRSYSPQSFLYSSELKALIKRLGQENRVVVFFWPPVPEGGAGSDLTSWGRAREHAEAFCRAYQVNCWLPTSPWSDHLFMDLWGHLGPLGRSRFASEFADWWDEIE